MESEQSFDYGIYFKEKPPALQEIKPQPRRTHLYQFEDAKRFGKVDRPTMNRQKQKMIQQKLQLNKEADMVSHDRIQKDNMIVRYKQNPFRDVKVNPLFSLQTQKPFKVGRTGLDSLNRQRLLQCQERIQSYKEHENIVEAVNELKRRDFPLEKRQYHQQIEDLQKLNNKWAAQIQYAQKKSVSVPSKPQEKIHVEAEPTFDEILQMEDNSYFQTNQKELNIFQMGKKIKKPYITNEILDKYFFSHLSLANKFSSNNIFYIRQMSQLGRNFSLDHCYKLPGRVDYLISKEISVNIENINCEDLINIASGRFTPEIVYKLVNDIGINDEEQKNIGSSNKEIDYRKETYNNSMNFDNGNIQKQEILDYLKKPNNKEENKYLKKCQAIKDDIEDNLLQKVKLVTQTIKDKTLHQQLSKNVDDRLQLMAKMDFWQTETDKKIRVNKATKNRNENTKIRTLIESLGQKRVEEGKIKEFLSNNK